MPCLQYMNNALQFTLGYDAMNPHPETPPSLEQFSSVWRDGMQGVGIRLTIGHLASLLLTAKFKKACREVHDFVEFHIQRALKTDNSKSEKKGSVGSFLEQTEDRTLIRSTLVQSIIGAQDTTSVLVSNTIHLLARHPALWKELRQEVLRHGDELFTFDALRSNELIQNMLSECELRSACLPHSGVLTSVSALRLRPIFAIIDRIARRDSTLPRGGGKDGTSRLFVKAGTRVEASFYAPHRDPAVYGPNVEEFDPHRWKTVKPTQYEYMAFSAGPGNCMGREKSLADATYLLAKLAGQFERLEARDDRPWIGTMTFSYANKYGCLVAFE